MVEEFGGVDDQAEAFLEVADQGHGVEGVDAELVEGPGGIDGRRVAPAPATGAAEAPCRLNPPSRR